MDGICWCRNTAHEPDCWTLQPLRTLQPPLILQGLTIRDIFAAAALAGQYAAGPGAWIDSREKMGLLAEACYRVADAMLAARSPAPTPLDPAPLVAALRKIAGPAHAHTDAPCSHVYAACIADLALAAWQAPR